MNILKASGASLASSCESIFTIKLILGQLIFIFDVMLYFMDEKLLLINYLIKLL